MVLQEGNMDDFFKLLKLWLMIMMSVNGIGLTFFHVYFSNCRVDYKCEVKCVHFIFEKGGKWEMWWMNETYVFRKVSKRINFMTNYNWYDTWLLNLFYLKILLDEHISIAIRNMKCELRNKWDKILLLLGSIIAYFNGL